MSRLDRITTDASVCHGQPTVRGLRYPVSMVLELLASGMTVDDVLDDYPDLEGDDVLAALEFGALTAGRSGSEQRDAPRRRAETGETGRSARRYAPARS